MESYSFCPVVSGSFRHRFLKAPVGGCVRTFFLFRAELSSLVWTDASSLSFDGTDSGVVSRSDCCELGCGERCGVNKCSVPVFSPCFQSLWVHPLERSAGWCGDSVSSTWRTHQAAFHSEHLMFWSQQRCSVQGCGFCPTSVNGHPAGCEVAARCHLHLNF